MLLADSVASIRAIVLVVGLGFAQGKTFMKLIGLQRIEKESRKFFAQQKTKKVVIIMPCGFESDSYNVVIARENFSIKLLEALTSVSESK